MENIFDALCSALSSSETKAIFVQEEGTELMVIMMREKLLARTRAIKVLDHAMSGEAGAQACETFVDAQGLKGLFSALMQTVSLNNSAPSHHRLNPAPSLRKRKLVKSGAF